MAHPDNPLVFRKNLLECIYNKIMTIDGQRKNFNTILKEKL